MLHTCRYAHVHVSYVRTYIRHTHTWLEYEEYSTCHNNTSVDAKASLEASLRELAAVVKLQCTAAVHRFLRGDGQLNTSAVMRKTKQGCVGSMVYPACIQSESRFYMYLAYVWFALLAKPPQLLKKKKKPSVASQHNYALELEPQF